MSLWQDLKFAARLLVKDRWFTAVAALAPSIGVRMALGAQARQVWWLVVQRGLV